LGLTCSPRRCWWPWWGFWRGSRLRRLRSPWPSHATRPALITQGGGVQISNWFGFRYILL